MPPKRKKKSTSLTKTPARKDTSLKLLDEAISREEWKEVLFAFIELPEAAKLLSFLEDPDYKTNSFSQLARTANINAGKLATLRKEYQKIEGTMRSSQHTPQIMEDVAVDSLSTQEACPKCGGSGVFKKAECGKCAGRGEIRKPGDTEARKLFYQSSGLVEKQTPQGPLAEFHFNVGSQGAPSPARTVEHVDRILDAEAEVVEEEQK